MYIYTVYMHTEKHSHTHTKYPRLTALTANIGAVICSDSLNMRTQRTYTNQKYQLRIHVGRWRTVHVLLKIYMHASAHKIHNSRSTLGRCCIAHILQSSCQNEIWTS